MAAGQWKISWKSQNLPFCEGLKKLSNDWISHKRASSKARTRTGALPFPRNHQEAAELMNILCFQCSGFCLSDLVALTFVGELLELVLKSNLLKEAPKRESFTNLSRFGTKIKESIPEKHQQGAKWWGQEIHVPLESETAAGTSLREARVFHSLQISEFWEKQRIDSSPFPQDTGSIHCRMIRNLINGFPADHRH